MNQHYVPKVYLKYFSERKKKEYFADVYNKENNQYFNTNIKNICAENNLYTLEDNSADANDILVIEKMYSDFIEPMYEKAYHILTDSTIYNITLSQRSEILIGVFQLYMRNPRFTKNAIKHHRNQISIFYHKAIIENKKGLTYLDEDFSFKEYSKDDIIEFFRNKITKDFKEKHIIGTREICEFHENAIFGVEEIKDDGEFFTSDNPLVYEDLVTKDEHPLLKSKEFLIPLNNKFLLRIFHKKGLSPNYIYRRKVPNGIADLMNEQIFSESSRFIIGNKVVFEKHFKTANKYFNSTSLESKIDLLRQVIKKVPNTDEYRESLNKIKYYLEKYDSDKTLSKADEHDLMMYIKKSNAEKKTFEI